MFVSSVTVNSSADDVETLLPELEDIAESSPSSSSTSSPEPAERLHDFGELEHVVQCRWTSYWHGMVNITVFG